MSGGKLTPADWARMAREILGLKGPFTIWQLAEAVGSTEHSVYQRLYKLSRKHGALHRRVARGKTSFNTERCATTYQITPRGAQVFRDMAAAAPISARALNREAAPVLSRWETDYRAMRATFKLPDPIDPWASTVSHAVAHS